jgi:prepilin-type N-terminal cleavage/methylation domain-containing protein
MLRTTMIRFMNGLRQRLATLKSEAGFTLMELLIVTVVLGLLATVGLASYVGLRERAGDVAARVAVREALPSVEAYFADNGTYAGMSLSALAEYDTGLDDSLAFSSLSERSYCVSAVAAGRFAHVSGPDNPQPQDGLCPGESPRTS